MVGTKEPTDSRPALDCKSHLHSSYAHLLTLIHFLMTCRKESETMCLTVTEGLTVTILPSLNHEFLMTTKEVASGYGTSQYAVRTAQSRHLSELVEGKHFVKGVTKCHTLMNAQPHQVFWTKRGIVRLGFFIKSERAKMFRDWIEELVLYRTEKQATLFDVPPITKQLPNRTKANRLTHERLLNIMADVCRIDDKELRLSLSTKLMQGGVQC